MYSLDDSYIFDRIQDSIMEMNIEESDEAVSEEVYNFNQEIAEEIMLGL